MMRFLTAAVSLALIVAGAARAQTPDVDIPYERFTLDNGLTVVVHEDRKAPIVAVSMWYGVGSKDEPEGKTGFAHLFEHLMFNGSEHYNDDYFKPFEQVGATGMNGTTWFDRTNYFQTVPTPALEMALWMESDRMTHLLGAIDQDKLDEQRGVVQNEKRQGDNQPYGMVDYSQLAALFPEGHPYAHSTIGSMEDLEAASLEDVYEWFEKYYGASNAVLVLAGDIDAAEARPLVERYFGDAPVGDPLPEFREWVPERERNTYETLRDRVPQARIYRTWVAPGRNSVTSAELELAADILGDGKNSRFYREFVYDRQIATDVNVFLQEHLLASFFEIQVTLKPGGQDVDEASAIIDELVADFLENGPTAEELRRAKTKINAQTVRGLEQIGGFSGKAVALAQGELYSDDPGFWKVTLERINNASADDVVGAARDWLRTGYHQIDVLPFGDLASAETGADRSALPQVDSTPDLTWPEVQTAQLSNGIEVVHVNRAAVPVVEVAMVFDAGYAADSNGGKLGLASFVMTMLDEGAGDMSALEISAEAERLGANLFTNTSLDDSTVRLSALESNLQESLDLMATVVREPTFPESELERLRRIRLAQIQQEKAQPVATALRLLPPLLYGEDHAYGVPFTGSGTEDSVESYAREDLAAHQANWLRPDNATLFVVGAASLEEIQPMLEAAFGDWQAPDSPLPEKNVSDVPMADAGRVVMVDKPGSPQTVLIAGLIGPHGTREDIDTIEAMNEALGGSFTSRVNMNLREDKGWAYGAFTFMPGARGQRPFAVYAPVQTDKTAESIQEILMELNGYTGDNPATGDELVKVVNNNVRALPGQFETAGSVLGSLLTSHRLDRDWNYPETIKAIYNGMTVEDLHQAAEEVIHPDRLLWVIVGDLDEIEEPVRALDLGPVEIREESSGS